jgi:hypothetical protein
MAGTIDDKKEACKTYIEQTKLLVTLASAFIVAPAALATLKGGGTTLGSALMEAFFWSEISFVGSVFSGYLVLGSIAGSQNKGEYNVYRAATMLLSWLQILTYVAGLSVFIKFVRLIMQMAAA